MARTRRNQSTDEVQPEITEGETMLDTENVPTGDVQEDVTTEETPEPAVSETSADNSSENNTGDNEVKEFDIPANPTDLDLGEELSTLLGRKILRGLNKIKSLRNLIQSQTEGDSTAAAIDYAESDEASQNIKDILSRHAEMTTLLREIEEQLISAVKDEKGEVKLTEDELNEKRDELKIALTSARTQIQTMSDIDRDNPDELTDDGRLFIATVQKITGARGASARAASGATSNYTQTSEVRPRLGDDGYVMVNDVRNANFAFAVRQIRKMTGDKNVNVGQVHRAWVKAAGKDDVSKWNEITDDVSFEMGPDDKKVTITVHKAA